ncbi:MAG: helix-turn-helix domain-containing protein [Bacilli bacterium]
MKEKAYIHDDEYYYTVIRKNIKKYRLAKKLTQQNLADMIEMSREYICDIENDSRNKHPTISVLGRIADALNIDIKDLFEDVNNSK